MTNEEARKMITVLSKGYKKRKKNNTLYTSYDHIPEKIIQIYYRSVTKPQFKNC